MSSPPETDSPPAQIAAPPEHTHTNPEFQRIIGAIRGTTPGPTMVIVAAQHGNEPSGVHAARRVIEHINETDAQVRGEILCITGNLRALNEGKRFIKQDLNRMWTPEQIERVTSVEEGELEYEEAEQRALHDHLIETFRRATETVHVIDLHTTSADSPPFAVIDDALRNRFLAQRLPTPIILGMEEVLIGTLPDWVNSLGHVSIGFEAGQHDAPHSIDRHEAAIWILLVAAGLVSESDAPDVLHRKGLITRKKAKLARFFELVHHHPVRDADDFNMEQGYENFQRIKPGQLLARDHTGNLLAPRKGRIFMPLYQKQGDDGFFIIRRVLGIWLWLSALLRVCRADAILPFLPGIRRSAHDRDVLIADSYIARVMLVELFHLLGYRRQRAVGKSVVFSKRIDALHKEAGPHTPTK